MTPDPFSFCLFFLLALLLMMSSILVGAAFFKGFVDERRQYLELLPSAGLIACQWAAAELGLKEVLRARDARTAAEGGEDAATTRREPTAVSQTEKEARPP